ncbi:hypothetical protein C2845_PM17G08780 [Panicum miliaceum]|uniref:Uncharacterized protein n=1 Tax=Panicum miliaceum TaxID=4540 RepID=A0A3L6PYW1_PANMI|nr:hypothetical protein C2845_PM17G08780 [Panicum miliaceum]
MPNTRGNNRDGLSEYEQQREASIASNKRRLEALKIPSICTAAQKVPPRKRTKNWMTPQCQARTEISIMNHAKLKLHHTSGSKSFACSRHELGEKFGRPARRDEVYIETHTRKNGVPSRQAEPIISPRSGEHDDEAQSDPECDGDDDHAEMNTMGDAHMMAIAWPYKKVKVSKASKSSLGAAGSSGKKMLGRMLEAACKLEEKCSCKLLCLFYFGAPGDAYFAQA